MLTLLSLIAQAIPTFTVHYVLGESVQLQLPWGPLALPRLRCHVIRLHNLFCDDQSYLPALYLWPVLLFKIYPGRFAAVSVLTFMCLDYLCSCYTPLIVQE